jgi:hypothetical protein
MRYVALIAVLLTAAGCATTRPQPTHLNQSLALSPKELASEERLAKQGDGEAAYRIATHYSFYVGDDREGQAWLKRSAVLGFAKAQSALGRRLVEDPADASKAEGMLLIRKSAVAGDDVSRRFLDHLRYLSTLSEEDLTRAQPRIPRLVDLVRYLARHPEELPRSRKMPNSESSVSQQPTQDSG